ncbi:Potassium channel domain-containing protein [uncultured Gammaproteobacteria bacterium]
MQGGTTMRAVVLTALLLSGIALTIKAVAGTLAFVLLGSIAFVIAVFHRVFPNSRFFTMALVNFIGIYACLFTIVVEGNFPNIGQREQAVGFIMPLIAFLIGACARAEMIRGIVQSRHLRDEARFAEIFVWLIPMFGMIGVTFALPAEGIRGTSPAIPFFLLIGVIAVIVIWVSRDIALFLIDTGLLFEGFFKQVARMIVPAFAFLTFYSILVIAFAVLYYLIDRLTGDPDFIIEGVRRSITFAESLYFSLVTLSTVGYGDILPHSGPARMLAAVEIVSGLLLLLFGFSAIIRHTPASERRDQDEI